MYYCLYVQVFIYIHLNVLAAPPSYHVIFCISCKYSFELSPDRHALKFVLLRNAALPSLCPATARRSAAQGSRSVNTMGGGNLQKSQMARAKNQAKAQAEAAGGGGSAGMKSRQADAGLHAKAQDERAKLSMEREARAKAKAEAEAKLSRKNAKLAAAAGGLAGDHSPASIPRPLA